MHLNLQFYQGLGMGAVLGILVGVTWEHAYEMIREGVRIRRERRTKMGTKDQSPNERDRTMLRRMAILLAITSVITVCVSAFTVYGYSRMSNFIKCQGNYNAGTYEARQPRVKASAKQDEAMTLWLLTLPPLLTPRDPGTPQDPRLVKAFRKELLNTVKTYQANLKAQETNPYPPDPKDTCGEY